MVPVLASFGQLRGAGEQHLRAVGGDPDRDRVGDRVGVGDGALGGGDFDAVGGVGAQVEAGQAVRLEEDLGAVVGDRRQGASWGSYPPPGAGVFGGAGEDRDQLQGSPSAHS